MRTILLITFCSLIFSACASKKSEQKKEIEQEIQITSMKDKRKVKHDIYQSVLDSELLTADQKEKLIKLSEKSKEEDHALKQEIESAKLVLIQTIVEPKMDQIKYNSIKNKITELTKKRLNLSFINAQEVRKIINKSNLSEDDRQMYNVIYRTHFYDN